MEEAEDVLGVGLSAGFKFQPDDDELLEYFLLPRILGEPLPFEGMIIEDDPLSAPPWKLLDDHKGGDEAFFFARGQAIHGGKGSRQKRTSVVGCWEGQKVCVEGERLCVHGSGKEIVWRKYMLNFHSKDEEGSKGWVMHEYSITAPANLASSSMRLYRVRFSGHGKNRKREPDDYCREARAAKRQATRADAEPDVLEEHISAADSFFPTAAVVADEDGGSTRPDAATSYSDQPYQYEWPQMDSFQDSSFLPVADVGEYAGPAATSSHQDFPGCNTSNLGADGAPGMIHEYDRVAAAASGLPPFGQGSFVPGESPFMDSELLPDEGFTIDELLGMLESDPCCP